MTNAVVKFSNRASAKREEIAVLSPDQMPVSDAVPYVVASRMPTLVFAKATDWLVAIGGVGAFIATAVLAFLAWRQMGKLDAQVHAARDQVDAMRETSAVELSAVREQVDASIEQNRAVREAARAQLQPVVLAHATQVVEGPDEEYSIREDQLAIAYYIANEGSGIALNIRHGVELDGHRYEFGDGLQTRVLVPGESQPMRDPVSSQLIWRVPLFVVRPREELSLMGSATYWASFQSIFGERFETLNPRRPDVPFMFSRVDDTGWRPFSDRTAL